MGICRTGVHPKEISDTLIWLVGNESFIYKGRKIFPLKNINQEVYGTVTSMYQISNDDLMYLWDIGLCKVINDWGQDTKPDVFIGQVAHNSIEGTLTICLPNQRLVFVSAELGEPL